MNRFIQIISLLFSILALQEGHAQAPSPEILKNKWDAYWISVPGEQPNDYGVYLFRKQIELDTKPSSFVIHVSADNRYKLYVNEKLVSLGPARGDLAHWNFETVDIAHALKQGKNIIAAKVWNEAGWRPEAQISLRTGFILQGATGDGQIINTNKTWKCIRDESYRPVKINLPVYYVAGPGELVDMKMHIRDWQKQELNEDAWKNAENLFQGSPKGFIGAFGTPEGWMLIPSSIPQMELKEQRFSKLRKVNGIDVPATFPAKKTAITIPANSTISFLLDQSALTNAYLNLIFNGGMDATIAINYAEALYSKYPEKGNRDEVEGKFIMGRKDSIISNGNSQQVFTTLYWRTFRFVQVNVITKEEPLVIEDIYSHFTGYPFEFRAKFEAPGPEAAKMLEIGWHTARLCAIETYMDCPFYEQLQYIGDTRIQGLVSLYNSGDDRLLRNAISQADESRQPEGVTFSRHPSYTPQYIPTFSLWYIGMLHDYWMYGRDTNFVKDKLPGARQVLEYFHRYQQKDGSLKDVPHWLFTDWVYEKGWEAGRGPVGKDGNSAMLDLQLLWAYQLAAEMEERSGIKEYAGLYRKYAEQLKTTIKKKYWAPNKRLFADRIEKDLYSQHTNSLAILTGMLNEKEALAIAQRMQKDTSITAATIYFKYYLHRAYVRTGLGNEYMHWLDTWRENIQMGMTTWAEMSDVNTSRSDCHAWGSSPNIEFFRTILGIDSDAPGFAKVKIEPHPGSFKNIGGEIPHPLGVIAVRYTNVNNKWKAVIDLPTKISGRFIWHGKTYLLKGGRNTFNLN